MPATPTVIDIDPDPSSGFEALFMAGLQQVKSVPEEILHQMPAETISVSDLLVANLPQSSQSVLRSPESCLSRQTPSWTAKCLWKTCVPPREWLSSLDIALDRGWANGIYLIEVPAGSKDLRFPLWIGSFWLEMAEVIEQREKWERARGWMLTMVWTPGIQEAEKVLDRTPWGLRLWPLIGHNRSTRVGFLAGLLSNEWLAERHIDTLVAYINDRFQKCRRPGATLVADSYLGSLLLRKGGKSMDELREDQELKTYGDKILHGHERLLFPAHIGGSASGHWVVFSVDIRQKEISYGECPHEQMTGCILTRCFVMKVTRSIPLSQDRT